MKFILSHAIVPEAMQLLDEVKESIVNAYEIKTGLSRTKISHMMDAETWMNAKSAKEQGFCDEILFVPDAAEAVIEQPVSFSRKLATSNLLNKLKAKIPENTTPEAPARIPVKTLDQRLALLKHF